MGSLKVLFRDLGIIILATVAGLVVLDLLFGLIAGKKHMSLVPHDGRSGTYGYFAPGQDREILFPGQEPYAVKTNALGFRDVGSVITAENLKQGKRVLCIGDSNTFGLFVSDRDTYPYRLQTLLGAGYPQVKVLNAGIGGTSIHDNLDYLVRKGLEIAPDLVVINFSTNDLEDLKRKTLVYDSFGVEGRQKARESNIIRAFREVYVKIKHGHWLRKVKDEKAREILSRGEGSLEDSLYVCEHYFAPAVLKTPGTPELETVWREYFSYLDRLIDVLQARRIPLIFFTHPEPLTIFGSTEGSYEEHLARHLEGRESVYFVALAPVFKARGGDDILALYNAPPRDFHLSGRGNQIVAETLLDVIRHNGLLKDRGSQF